MIFVTVGSQMPFDRMVKAVDSWAARNPSHPVFAQIGRTDFKPKNIEFCEGLAPAEFRRRVASAELIVAHAGMGSVLTALEFSKPLVLVPRRGDLRETRNDHQLATARWLAGKPGIEVAKDESELDALLDRAIQSSGLLKPAAPLPASALIQFLRGYLNNAEGG